MAAHWSESPARNSAFRSFEATRPGQMKALAIADTKVDEHIEFSCRLNTLGNHFGSDLLAERDKRPGESAPDGV